MAETRLLTRAAMRVYLGGLPAKEIDARIATGLLPKPLWGLDGDDPRARWDRRAIDRALDLASRMPATLEAQGEAMDRALGIR